MLEPVNPPKGEKMHTFTKILTCLITSCCALSSLSAETLGNVEYQIPQGAGWKLRTLSPELNPIRSPIDFVQIWDPEGKSPKEVDEVFFVQKVPGAKQIKDQADLKDGIERGMRRKFENPVVNVTVVDTNPDSALYEFSVSSGGEEKEHGWVRLFTAPEGTTMLTYQTELVDQINDKRAFWLPILKEAKIVQPQPATE